ncbi:EcsC family protein [Shimia thalassica]|uniref:EcsC family protein n=1 Tax=Shimia thalassica TaxID=1715693 RepID=UPI0026E12A9B|nr:EcsC family protein [Shimia thalassica]MDO6479574.1 EcsC family protein [Shimia thalassica]
MSNAELIWSQDHLPRDVDAELMRLALRYEAAGGAGIELLGLLGSHAEGLFEKLPEQVRMHIEGATDQSLRQAMKVAQSSRSVVGDRVGWLNTAVAGALGAAGGFGGTPTALAELPVTTMILLREIQSEAARLGFDPASENVQFDCVQVFGAAGPLARDDRADMAFVGARMALTSGSMQALVGKVVPKLSVILGKKLAVQAVPVFGAVAGAAVNYAYITYYREISHVHFGLRKLAIDSGTDHNTLVADLKNRVEYIKSR